MAMVSPIILHNPWTWCNDANSRRSWPPINDAMAVFLLLEHFFTLNLASFCRRCHHLRQPPVQRKKTAEVVIYAGQRQLGEMHPCNTVPSVAVDHNAPANPPAFSSLPPHSTMRHSHRQRGSAESVPFHWQTFPGRPENFPASSVCFFGFEKGMKVLGVSDFAPLLRLFLRADTPLLRTAVLSLVVNAYQNYCGRIFWRPRASSSLPTALLSSSCRIHLHPSTFKLSTRPPEVKAA